MEAFCKNLDECVLNCKIKVLNFELYRMLVLFSFSLFDSEL